MLLAGDDLEQVPVLVLPGLRWRLQLLHRQALLILQVDIDEALVGLAGWAHGGQHAQSDDTIFAELDALICQFLADELGKVDFLADEHLALSIALLEQNFDVSLLELGAILSEVEAAIFLEFFVIERDFFRISTNMIGI